MITLHGFAFSNYYNIVKHVLMYKGINFREDLRFGDDEAWKEISPVGKIPAISNEAGQHLSESSVCCDYLEESFPDKPLYPSDAYERNRVRQIMKISELYLELPFRRLIPFIFMNAEIPEPIENEVRATAKQGFAALRGLLRFEPFLAGSEMTMADIYLRYVLSVATMAGTSKLDWDTLAEIDGLQEWYARMADSDISRKIDAEQQANTAPFFEHLEQRYGMPMGKHLMD